MRRDPTEQWSARPGLAGLLRAAIVGVPVLAGTLAAHTAAPWIVKDHGRFTSAAILMVVGAAVSVLVSRVTSKYLPLAALLRMTMIFPDRAPSRLKIARRTNSVKDIQARLNSPRIGESEAANTMLALVGALGRHDRHTRGHSERVRLFCDLLCRELGLSAADGGRLRWAALIHDIGKLEIAATVLNKPAQLSEDEWSLIREHPDAGARLAAPLKDWLGPWYAGIAEHHERWDGSGYPRGLAASGISMAGRAIAVVDAYETMTASRSYKASRTALSARAELTRCAGSHFDPDMVRAFLNIALPRLLWSVGPLAFLVNAPFLRGIGQSGMRIGTAVNAATVSATNAAGVTAVAMAVATAPVSLTAAPHPTAVKHHQIEVAAAQTVDRSGGPVTDDGPVTTTATSRTTATKAVAKKAVAKKAAVKKAAAKRAAPTPPRKAAPPKQPTPPRPPAKKTPPAHTPAHPKPPHPAPSRPSSTRAHHGMTWLQWWTWWHRHHH